jgi:predicted metal-dependent phosphoesterase TrpH
MKFDLHVHSIYSPDGHMEVKDIVALAKKQGLGGVAVTDHNAFEAYKQFPDFKDSGLILIPAMEVSSRVGHILAYGIRSPIPRTLTLEDTIDRIKDAGGLPVASHPYRKVTGMGEDNVIRGRFRYLEGFNGRTRHSANMKAVALARRIGASITGGSDAHLPEELGSTVTIIPDSVSSVDDLLDVIYKGLSTAEGAQPGFKKVIQTSGSNVVRWVKRGGRWM